MTLNWFRVYKELRALAPVWALGALAILGFALVGTVEMDIEYRLFFLAASFGMYAVIAFVMGAMCFGSEFDEGTLQPLLSQPAPRALIWVEKNIALFVLMATCHLVLCVGLWLLRDHLGDYSSTISAYVTLGLLILVYAGIGGPFCSLFLKQTHLAVWISMVAPFLLIVVPHFLNFLSENLTGIDFLSDLQRHRLALAFVLTIPWYFFAYLLTRYKFLNLEVASVERGSKVSDDDFSLLPGSSRAVSYPVLRNRWAVTIGKELRLQRSSLLFGFILALSWFLVIRFAFDLQSQDSREFLVMLEALLRVFTFFFLPVSIGASAVASEREQGVVGWQQSLPFSRRKQWAIKCLVCFALTGFFAWMMGVNLDRILIGVQAHTDGPRFEPLPYWVGILAIGPTIAGLYASSLARSTLIALVGGIVLCAVSFYAVIGVITLSENGWGILMRGSAMEWLPWLVCGVVGMVAVLVYASGYRNYADLHLDRKRIPVQVGIWVLMVYSVASLVQILGDLY